MTESQLNILTFVVILVLIGFFIPGGLIDLHFNYQHRRRDYSRFFCMAVIYGANFEEACENAYLQYECKYPDHVDAFKWVKTRKAYLEFLKEEYSTYYLVSRARLPPGHSLWIPHPFVPEHVLYFL
jgi:hypothetical protein